MPKDPFLGSDGRSMRILDMIHTDVPGVHDSEGELEREADLWFVILRSLVV